MNDRHVKLGKMYLDATASGRGFEFENGVVAVRMDTDGRNLWEIRVDGDTEDVVDASAFRATSDLEGYIAQFEGDVETAPEGWVQ